MPPIFQPDERLAVGRISLSALTEDALAPMLPWLEGWLAPDWTADVLSAPVSEGEAVLISEAATGGAIGVAVARFDAPTPGAVAVPFISIDPARRYRGLGGEATLALERHLRARFGIERVYAAIPDWRGLAVYFWLRQGYRPVTGSEAPWALTGLGAEPRPGIWMLRDIP